MLSRTSLRLAFALSRLTCEMQIKMQEDAIFSYLVSAFVYALQSLTRVSSYVCICTCVCICAVRVNQA